MPSILASVAIGTAVAGTGIAMAGQAQQAKAASQAAAYNAQVSQRNSQVSLQNAGLASEAGNVQVEQSELRSRANMGEIKANEGASGVDIGSGSFKDIQKSANALGQEDALNIRANAVKEAYGYQVQSQGYAAQGNLQTAESKNAITAGNYQMASTFLGGASQGSSQWANFKLQGAFGNTSGLESVSLTPSPVTGKY